MLEAVLAWSTALSAHLAPEDVHRASECASVGASHQRESDLQVASLAILMFLFPALQRAERAVEQEVRPVLIPGSTHLPCLIVEGEARNRHILCKAFCLEVAMPDGLGLRMQADVNRDCRA